MIENKIYAIIVTYNAMKWAERCFTSLKESKIPILPVVVDNGSTDDTILYIKEFFPEAYIICNKKNVGFGQANNQGLEYAYKQGATHVLLLNQDAWIFNDTIDVLLSVQEENNIDLLSPIHLSGDGTIMDKDFFYSFLESDKRNNYIVTSLLRGERPAFFLTVHTICAAAWFLPRRTIETIGGFDPIYFHYGEDNNYIQRLKYHTKKIAVCPNAYILHDRKQHGNMKMYNKQSVLRDLLACYTDINHVKLTKKVLVHLKHGAKLLIYLFTMKLVRCLNIIRSYYEFCKRIPKINNSKVQNRNIGPSWLNLESPSVI